MLVNKHSACESITIQRYCDPVATANTTHCPQCASELEIHQPDIYSPYRVLGTCPECAQWVVIDYSEPGVAQVVELPRPEGLTVKRITRGTFNVGRSA